MSIWQDFLDQFGASSHRPDSSTVPGEVMICFVNRYLEALDDVHYKLQLSNNTYEGKTTEAQYCVKFTPKTLDPIRVFVWARKKNAFKELESVVPKVGRNVLMRKIIKTYKAPGKTEPHPSDQPIAKPPGKPAPAPAPGPSPTDPQGVKPIPGKDESGLPQTDVERPVPDKITQEQLKKIFPAAKVDYLQRIADELNKNLPKFKLDTTIRRAHFFGQVKQEAGPLMSGAPESFNYKASVLLAKFSYYKHHHGEAKTDGRAENSKVALTLAQQQVIANKVYGPEGNRGVGNDRTQPNDGWNFRGRGMKQTTGRTNYQQFEEKHKELWGEDVGFVAHPDKVSEMPYAIRSAVVFWVYKHCWQAADGGINDNAIDAVTHIVNPGELAAYNKHPTTDSPVLNRRKYTRLAYAAFS
jgi:predicted chitinase